MKRPMVLLLAVSLALLPSASGIAQTRYDNNCNEREPTAEELALEEFAGGSSIGAIASKFMAKTCRGIGFIRNLFEKKPDPDDWMANDVFEAAKPELPKLAANEKPEKVYQYNQLVPPEHNPSYNPIDWSKNISPDGKILYPGREGGFISIFQARKKEDKAGDAAVDVQAETLGDTAADAGQAPPANEESTVPLNQGGFIDIFQSGETLDPAMLAATPDTIDGEGILLSEDGLERGQFENGELNGPGEEINIDGFWRGGNFENGSLEGAGFEVGQMDGETYYLEGNFENDMPDGMVTMRYDGGNMRRVLFEGGQAVAFGPMGKAGQVLDESNMKTRAQMLAEAEQRRDAEFLASLDTAKSAGALYAMADEFAEKGETEKARKIYREILKRFPDSPLATQAAAQLSTTGKSGPASSSGGTGLSGMPAGAQTKDLGPPGPQVIYGTLVPKPLMWRAFYDRFNSMTAAECADNAMRNDPEVVEFLRFIDGIPNASLVDGIRLTAASHEATLIALVRCKPKDPAIAEYRSAIQQTLQTCRQIASDPAICERPLK